MLGGPLQKPLHCEAHEGFERQYKKLPALRLQRGLHGGILESQAEQLAVASQQQGLDVVALGSSPS